MLQMCYTYIITEITNKIYREQLGTKTKLISFFINPLTILSDPLYIKKTTPA